MLSRPWTERIRDILDAIKEIQEFTNGMTFDVFELDQKTIKAVELNFIIIGEAANHISEEVRNQYNNVPWHLMRAMRNQLVHAYFSIEPRIIWDTVQDDLPSLIEPLSRLLADQKD
ncbi:MAG: hypothetical protein ACI8V2_003587 [Candidatus Latescibacterota bacterium]|jgi:uncharacterized protein with HEPN domain